MKRKIILFLMMMVLCQMLSAQGSKLYRTTLRNPTNTTITVPPTVPTPDTAYYIILAGQSNAEGQVDTSALTGYYTSLKDTLNGYIFNGSSFPRMIAGKNTYGGSLGKFGSEIPLADTLFKAQGKGYYIVKEAHGNTYMCNTAGGDWLPSLSGELYTTYKSTIQSAKVTLQNNGKVPVCLGVIWLQGENDATNLSCANAYQTNLEAFIDSTRNFMSLPTLPFIIALNNGSGDGSEVYRTTIRAAQQAVSKVEYTSYSAGFIPSTTAFTRDNTYLINTLDYTLLDGVHFNVGGVIQFGQDVFKVMKGQNILR